MHDVDITTVKVGARLPSSGAGRTEDVTTECMMVVALHRMGGSGVT